MAISRSSPSHLHRSSSHHPISKPSNPELCTGPLQRSVTSGGASLLLHPPEVGTTGSIHSLLHRDVQCPPHQASIDVTEAVLPAPSATAQTNKTWKLGNLIMGSRKGSSEVYQHHLHHKQTAPVVEGPREMRTYPPKPKWKRFLDRVLKGRGALRARHSAPLPPARPCVRHSHGGKEMIWERRNFAHIAPLEDIQRRPA